MFNKMSFREELGVRLEGQHFLLFATNRLPILMIYRYLFEFLSVCNVFTCSGFKSEKQLEKNATDVEWGQLYLGAIVFNISSANQYDLPYKIEYTVRPKAEPYNKSDTEGMQESSGWMTNQKFPGRVNKKESLKTKFGWVPPGKFIIICLYYVLMIIVGMCVNVIT